ncbi:MAG: SWIM zinc finger family protein, partial [Acetobacteraceae bacterium]
MAMGYHDGWAEYVPVAERRRRALRSAEKLCRQGQKLSPVVIQGRAVATTFWGKAWCENLESYRDYEYRLPRGRAYARNGAVLDLQIRPTEVVALVSGTSLYSVKIGIAGIGKSQWAGICRDCAGGIDSLVELLQGRLSRSVMERICRQEAGLFPKPAEIRFSCTCPDYAAMCKHVAAALYGVGARLDAEPELLFRLRAVNETELLASAEVAPPAARRAPRPGRVLDGADLSRLFGVDIDAAGGAGGGVARKADKPAPAKRARAGRIARAGGIADVKQPRAKAEPGKRKRVRSGPVGKAAQGAT